MATSGLKLEDAHTVRVTRLSVVPSARGHGYGAAMLRALLEEARTRGFERAVLTTGADWQSAIALYERAGFSSMTSIFESATNFHSLEFARDLTAIRQ